MAKNKLTEARKKREFHIRKSQSYKEISEQINIQTANNKSDKQNKGDTYLKHERNIIDNNEVGKSLFTSEISEIINISQSNEFPVTEEEIEMIGEENKYCCELM